MKLINNKNYKEHSILTVNMDTSEMLNIEQKREVTTFNLSDLDLDEDSDFENFNTDSFADSPEAQQPLPVLTRSNAVKPEKIIHENIGNMTSKQIMAQTRAALDE